MVVKWRGKPIFIRNRTETEIEEAKGVPMDELKDKSARNANLDNPASEATDVNRTPEGKENLIIMVGVCTHLGCIPLGEQGEYGGWFCPLPRFPLRYLGPHPQRPGAGKSAGSPVPIYLRLGRKDRLTDLTGDLT